MLYSWKGKNPKNLIYYVLPRHAFPNEISTVIWADLLFQPPVVKEVTGLDVTVNNTKVMNTSQCFKQIKHIFSYFFKRQCVQNVLKD